MYKIVKIQKNAIFKKKVAYESFVALFGEIHFLIQHLVFFIYSFDE